MTTVRARSIHPIRRVLFEFRIPLSVLARAAQIDRTYLGRKLDGLRPLPPEQEARLKELLGALVTEAAERNAIQVETG